MAIIVIIITMKRPHRACVVFIVLCSASRRMNRPTANIKFVANNHLIGLDRPMHLVRNALYLLFTHPRSGDPEIRHLQSIALLNRFHRMHSTPERNHSKRIEEIKMKMKWQTRRAKAKKKKKNTISHRSIAQSAVCQSVYLVDGNVH